MFSFKRFTLPLAGIALALVGGASLAVSSSRAQQTHQPATADSAQQSAVTAQVALAAFQMDNAGLHDLDEAVAAGRIPSGALGRVRKVRIVAAATQWPASMQPMAQEFVAHTTGLEAALQAEDAAAAAPDAKAVHDIGHELSAAVYSWLAQQSGTSAGDHGHP